MIDVSKVEQIRLSPQARYQDSPRAAVQQQAARVAKTLFYFNELDAPVNQKISVPKARLRERDYSKPMKCSTDLLSPQYLP
jgi:hypothetical protein